MEALEYFYKKFKTLPEKVFKDLKHIIPEIVCSLENSILAPHCFESHKELQNVSSFDLHRKPKKARPCVDRMSQLARICRRG